MNAKANGTMVRVILLFAFHIFHRIGPGHLRPTWANDRPEVTLVGHRVVGHIACEKLAIDIYGNVAILLLHNRVLGTVGTGIR